MVCQSYSGQAGRGLQPASRCRMSTITMKQAPTPTAQLDRAASELTAARARLTASSLAERRALMEDCLDRLVQLSPEWIEAACEAKGIPAGSPLRGEEIAA